MVADGQLGHRGNSCEQIWARQNANDAFNFLWAHVLIGSHTSALLPARAAGASKSGGREGRGDRGRKTRRRSRQAPPPELRDGRRKHLCLAVLRFSSPEPPRCHQVFRFNLAARSPRVSSRLRGSVVRRAVAAHGRGTSPSRAPLSACGGSFAQVMKSDER